MIDNIFLLKLVLSFFVAGGYLVAIVSASEKLSPKVGGILAGIPSTILIGTIFITWSEGAEVTRTSLLLIPTMVIISQIFVLIYLRFCRISLLLGILLASMTWLIFAWPIRHLLSDINFWTSFTLGTVGCLAFGLYFSTFKDGKKATLPAGTNIQIVRFIAAGTVVALAVLFARILDPFWAGTITAFPALFATSLYFLSRSHGSAFAKSFAKQLPISIIGTIFFVASLYLLLDKISVVVAFTLSILVAVLYAAALLVMKGGLKPSD